MDSEPLVHLIGRTSSHFTRAAAIFAHELGVPYTLVVAYDLTSKDPAAYGGHPGLKVPTLRVGASVLFGTENICRRLAELAGRGGDARLVWPERITSDLARNAQELTWHAMAAQVQVVVGTALGRLPEDHVVLAKSRAGLHGALTWLDQHLPEVLAAMPRPRDLSLLEVLLFCLVDHLSFRRTLPVDPYPNLRRLASEFATRASARRTEYRYDAGPLALPGETMPLRHPALDPATVPPRTTSGYPEAFRSRVLPREKRALGDALGLTRFGVNLTTLFPGKESSLRHYHEREDEMVFVLEGEVVLRSDEGEQVLGAGMCAGFPAGTKNGHQLVNRSNRPARYLEIGNRDADDAVGYVEVDLASKKTSGGAWVYTRKDGGPY